MLLYLIALNIDNDSLHCPFCFGRSKHEWKAYVEADPWLTWKQYEHSGDETKINTSH